MLRLDPAYVDRVLAGQNEGVIRDLGQLASFWSLRAVLDETGKITGLSPTEYRVQLVLAYVGEVGNGGHVQYFMNPGGAFAHDTVQALRDIGAGHAADVLTSALALFPSGPPRDRTVRFSAVQALNDTALGALDVADYGIHSTAVHIHDLALRHLAEHKDDVLTREQM